MIPLQNAAETVFVLTGQDVCNTSSAHRVRPEGYARKKMNRLTSFVEPKAKVFSVTTMALFTWLDHDRHKLHGADQI